MPEVVLIVVPQAVPSEIDWQSYPHNSKDTYTLKNRANKVAERIKGCGTSNELNKLIFLGKVTEIELNWLVRALLKSYREEAASTNPFSNSRKFVFYSFKGGRSNRGANLPK